MLGAQVTATILLLSKRDVESDFKSRSLRSDVIRVLIQCRGDCPACSARCDAHRLSATTVDASRASAMRDWLQQQDCG